MKKILTTLFALFVLVSFAHATASSTDAQAHLAAIQNEQVDFATQQEFNLLTLTPKAYKEQTGKRLGLKKSIQLKLAQKMLKKQAKKAKKKGADIPQGLYIVMAIFGLAWLAMGLMDDFEGNNWWINLILYLILWLPGLIHALIMMGDYY